MRIGYTEHTTGPRRGEAKAKREERKFPGETSRGNRAVFSFRIGWLFLFLDVICPFLCLPVFFHTPTEKVPGTTHGNFISDLNFGLRRGYGTNARTKWQGQNGKNKIARTKWQDIPTTQLSENANKIKKTSFSSNLLGVATFSVSFLHYFSGFLGMRLMLSFSLGCEMAQTWERHRTDRRKVSFPADKLVGDCFERLFLWGFCWRFQQRSGRVFRGQW